MYLTIYSIHYVQLYWLNIPIARALMKELILKAIGFRTKPLLNEKMMYWRWNCHEKDRFDTIQIRPVFFFLKCQLKARVLYMTHWVYIQPPCCGLPMVGTRLIVFSEDFIQYRLLVPTAVARLCHSRLQMAAVLNGMHQYPLFTSTDYL